MIEYADYDGLGLAALVAAGEVSPAELLEAAIKSAEALNPQLNAINHALYEHGRALAAKPLPAGPFHGVPFLIKDLGSPFIGLPHSKGCSALKDHIAAEHSEMARRFLNTGVVPFGKTNAPEFGLMGITEPKAFGVTRSPWDLERTPGGSSGGSAAAVAAGIAPIASAGDGGGSIRIPASCCGLFGLKPSRGRNPLGPSGESWQGAVVEHILSRSVRDSAAMLDATHGDDIHAPFVVKPPAASYMSLLDTAPEKLKVGFSVESPVGQPVAPDCIEAVRHTCALLANLGHEVEEVPCPYDGLALAKAYFVLYFGEVAADIDALEELLGRRVSKNDIETTTRTLGLLGHAFSAKDFSKARKYWHQLVIAMGNFHQSYDLYLTPTIAVLPPLIGDNEPSRAEAVLMNVINTLGAGRLLKALGVVDKLATESMAKMPFTQVANMTGQPAMSVPLYWTADNLPVGVQFIAPNGREDILFQLGAELERAQPWINKKPPLYASGT
ncbi:MAG: amidase [Gammaproteobacteria bacterium]